MPSTLSQDLEARKSRLWQKTSFAPKLKSASSKGHARGSAQSPTPVAHDPRQAQAVQALIDEAARLKDQAQASGPSAGYSRPKYTVNQRFLQNTVVTAWTQNLRQGASRRSAATHSPSQRSAQSN